MLKYYFSPDQFLGEICLKLPNCGTAEKKWCTSIVEGVVVVVVVVVVARVSCRKTYKIPRRLEDANEQGDYSCE